MDHPFRSYLKNRLYQDMTRESIPPCLRAEDRQTSAFGLENCVPFFDHRLVEFMFRMPGEMKIRKGVTKHLLRQAMQGVLPEETRTRTKKVGWNAPAHKWFMGPGLARLKEMVHDRGFQQRGIFDVKEVTRLLAEHEDIVTHGKNIDNHMMFFWQLVNLETWLRRLDAGA
jgi:asparagine synthase (glutamine-hydrolysing)